MTVAKVVQMTVIDLIMQCLLASREFFILGHGKIILWSTAIIEPGL
jgi:hypothetical protein